MVDMIQFWSNQIIANGVNLEQVLEAMAHASDVEGGGTVDMPLKTEDITRALQRERRLLTNYRDRKQYPHLRGGRPKRVAFYVELAGVVGKEKALIRATSELSPRSIFRLKRLLNV